MNNDQLFYQIICMYRKQRAFRGAKQQMALWRATRAIAKGAK